MKKIITVVLVVVMMIAMTSVATAASFLDTDVHGGPSNTYLVSSTATGDGDFWYDLNVDLNGQPNITYRVYQGSNHASGTWRLVSDYSQTRDYLAAYANSTAVMQLKASIRSSNTSDYATTNGSFVA